MTASTKELQIFVDFVTPKLADHSGASVLFTALVQIAALNDIPASETLDRTGNYACFGEPHSVEIARIALTSIIEMKD